MNVNIPIDSWHLITLILGTALSGLLSFIGWFWGKLSLKIDDLHNRYEEIEKSIHNMILQIEEQEKKIENMDKKLDDIQDIANKMLYGILELKGSKRNYMDMFDDISKIRFRNMKDGDLV